MKVLMKSNLKFENL